MQLSLSSRNLTSVGASADTRPGHLVLPPKGFAAPLSSPSIQANSSCQISHSVTLDSLTIGDGVVVTFGDASGLPECVPSIPAIQFSSTDPLPTARRYHTATLLQNGNVLIAGGEEGTTGLPLSSAYLYDPTNHHFTATGALSHPRLRHRAVRLHNGRVLIVGGYTLAGAATASAELYDPQTGTFNDVGDMTTPRGDPTATLLKGTQVLIAGGSAGLPAGVLATAELFDPSSGLFVETQYPMVAARHLQTSTLLPNGKVLLAGGYNVSHALTSEASLYDPETQTFSPTGALGLKRSWHTSTLLLSGKVLIAGGFVDGDFKWAELYNPISGTFSPTGPMTMGRAYSEATLLLDGKVLMTGGFDHGLMIAQSEVYDPDLGIFSRSGNALTARDSHQATLLRNGDVLITGGENLGGFLSDSELALTGQQTIVQADLMRNFQLSTTAIKDFVTLTYPSATVISVKFSGPAQNPTLNSLTPYTGPNRLMTAATYTLNSSGMIVGSTAQFSDTTLGTLVAQVNYADGAASSVIITRPSTGATVLTETIFHAPENPGVSGRQHVLITRENANIQNLWVDEDNPNVQRLYSNWTTHLDWFLLDQETKDGVTEFCYWTYTSSNQVGDMVLDFGFKDGLWQGTFVQMDGTGPKTVISDPTLDGFYLKSSIWIDAGGSAGH